MIKHTEFLSYLLFICRPTRTLASQMKGMTESETVLGQEVEEQVTGGWRRQRPLRYDDARVDKMDRTCDKHKEVTNGRKFCQQPEVKKLFWRRGPTWKGNIAIPRQTGQYGGKRGPLTAGKFRGTGNIQKNHHPTISITTWSLQIALNLRQMMLIITGHSVAIISL